jgi:hypothetical protein
LDQSKQDRKYMLSLSGEFLVAGELLRRNVSAAVTYGHAKKVDVVAVAGSSARSIEVKTTQEPKWIIGGKVPESNNSIWVLVYLPIDDLEPAEFFVLTGFDLHAILKPIEDDWVRKCQERHGHLMPAVYSVRRNQVESHKSTWQKILTALESSPQSK